MDKKILIIEDDQRTAEVLADIASELCISIDHSSDGEEGLMLASKGGFSLVILDLGLPSLDGLDVCRTLRAKKPGLPIIIVSARNMETDRVIGLELGADDYLVKPFGAHELRARIRAVLRRVDRMAQFPDTLDTGPIQLDIGQRTVSVNGKSVELTALEFDLLAHFVAAPGRVFSRDDLMRAVWGFDANAFGPSITAQVCRLRSKIEPNPAKPRYLLTVHGVGYRFASV